MIDEIISFSLRQLVFVLLAAAGLLAAGLWSAARLPIDAVPDITNIQVQINTEIKGLAPEEIEKLVTYPLEMEMFGVPGMTQLRSLSKFGLSQITLVFEEGTDIYRARQLVSERLQNAVDDLPRDVSPKLAPITTGLGEIYYYVVDYQPGYGGSDKPTNRDEQLMELKLIHDFVVKPQLRSVPGIAEVNASGGYEKQVVILPNRTSSGQWRTFKELSDTIGETSRMQAAASFSLAASRSPFAPTGVFNQPRVGILPVKFRAGGTARVRISPTSRSEKTFARDRQPTTGRKPYSGQP
jgi:cobalt-zinc-cadmium resistance protein CzcA